MNRPAAGHTSTAQSSRRYVRARAIEGCYRWRFTCESIDQIMQAVRSILTTGSGHRHALNLSGTAFGTFRLRVGLSRHDGAPHLTLVHGHARPTCWAGGHGMRGHLADFIQSFEQRPGGKAAGGIGDRS